MNNLIAYFTDASQAEKAIGALTDHGVEKEHLAFITSDQNLEKLYTADAAKQARERSKGVTTTTANDAATGGLKGAGAGLGIGALAGLASLFIPGSGLVFGGGALLTASLSALGAGAAGGVAGAVTGYLKDQGLKDSLVGEYKDALTNHGAVVAVEVAKDDTSTEQIRRILTKYDGSGISETKAVMASSVK